MPTSASPERRSDDPELLAASERMRAQLEALVPHFWRGIPKGERLVVKAPFAVGDGRSEYMSVEASGFGESLSGVLLERLHVSGGPGPRVGGRWPHYA